MIKIISKPGNWNIIIGETHYNFYYSDIKATEGLILNGWDNQLKEYEIEGNLITAIKEENRYILNIDKK